MAWAPFLHAEFAEVEQRWSIIGFIVVLSVPVAGLMVAPRLLRGTVAEVDELLG